MSFVVKLIPAKMKNALFILGVILFVSQCTAPPEKPALAPVHPVVNEYWGIELTDPYQYMENWMTVLSRTG